MSLIGDMTRASLREIGDWVTKSDDDVPQPMMVDALRKAGLADPTEEKPRALFHDPYSVMDWGGWRQRPSALTYDTLRQMSVSNTVITAIIQLRVDQVAQFGVAQQGDYDKGFRVIKRDRRDKKKMTREEQKRATEIERMIGSTGYLLPDERPYDRDTFRSFLKKSIRDCMMYDQMCFEKIRDRKGRPSRFICLPSETIRPAVADVEHMDPAERRDRVAYVQVYEETVIAEFGPDDLAWCVKNPRSDLRVNGFGFSPVEQIIRLVTAWLYGFEYNTRFFTQGSAIKGIINIKGAIPDRQLRAFRRMWYSMISGVQNAWKTPILNSEDISWHSLHSTNREMEFGAWMDWLTKLTCSVFGVDPVEINFIFGGGGSGGGGSAMFDRRPNKAEVTESKDKGLTPLVQHIQDCMNQHIVWELDEDFVFKFTGLDAQSEAKEREARNVEVRGWKTVNQVLAEQDLDKMPGELGDVILDPTWLQWASQIKQEEQEANQPPEPAGPLPESPDEEKPSAAAELGPGAPGPAVEGPPGEEEKEPLAASFDATMARLDELRKGERRWTLAGSQQIIEIETGDS